jgi:hypothetical protein
MQHWQTYYQQNKHLPLTEIMKGYNRLLNEFNERMVRVAQQNTTSGGPTTTVNLPVFGYIPTSQLLDWYTGDSYSGDFYANVTLFNFNTNVNPTAVRTLKIYDSTNPITSISNLSTLTNLYTLEIHYQLLTTVYISDNTDLQVLNCGYNQLTSLNVSNNTALRVLYCDYNQLTSLNVSNNTALTDLICENNQLTTLDVSNNTALDYLPCSNNQLTTLDVTNNTNLRNLQCSNNQLTSLDISNNILLGYLLADSNLLTETTINNILIALVNTGLIDGFTRIDGPGNAAPSGTGITAKNTLISRSWLVYTN